MAILCKAPFKKESTETFNYFQKTQDMKPVLKALFHMDFFLLNLLWIKLNNGLL